MSENLQPVTDDTFEEEVLKSDKPVLVDFWAAWCAPCRMLTPIVEEVAQEFSDQAKVLTLNVDENSGTSSKYNIKGIPTLLLFNGGEVKDQSGGSTAKDNIAKWSQGVQESTFPFKWDGKFFANFPPSWETLAPSQHFACSQQNQPGAQVIIRMEPARGAESGGKEAGARL